MKAECQQCGSCCRGSLLVEAYYVDVLRHPALLEPGAWMLDELEAEHEDRCIVLARDYPCRFLRGTHCSIYPTRPTACVFMQAGTTQCTDARRMFDLKAVRAKRAKRKAVPA